MTRVVIVGEIYNADLSIGGGPIIPPGRPPSGPVDPGYSPPWARPRPPGGPVDPGYSPPWAQAPVDPGYSPPWARPGGGPVDPGYGIPETGRPYPSQPIYFPPEPTHPIVLPPDLPPTLPDPDNRPIEWKTGWTAETGWVVVGIPQVPVPTPA